MYTTHCLCSLFWSLAIPLQWLGTEEPLVVEEENREMEHDTRRWVVCAPFLLHADLERREHRCTGRFLVCVSCLLHIGSSNQGKERYP